MAEIITALEKIREFFRNTGALTHAAMVTDWIDELETGRFFERQRNVAALYKQKKEEQK
jgi:hypothetical protein